MYSRLSSLLIVAILLAGVAVAKDKKKPVLPGYILQARTVLVTIDPETGEPLDQPNANAVARENVEKALMEWGRFHLVMDGEESDLVFMVRTGNGRGMRPTMKGGPIDQRPGVGQSTDSSIRIGGQAGHAPSMSDPTIDPQDRRPHIGNEAGPSEDMLQVYRGGVQYPLDSSPAWRYIAKDCLRAPEVTAVEQFRKAIAEAEKAQAQSKKPSQP